MFLLITQIKFGLDEKKYTSGSILSDDNEIEEILDAGEYWLHVLLVDKSGSRNEIISNGSVVVKDVLGFGCTKTEQSIKLFPGRYKIECWGAEGGGQNHSGGNGAYTSGILTISGTSRELFLLVGGAGSCAAGRPGDGGGIPGGYNGGGAGAWNDKRSPSGGGATDIRLISISNSDARVSLLSRIMVAGGGGGSGGSSRTAGSMTRLGIAGDADTSANIDGGCGTQTAGGAKGVGTTGNDAGAGAFGKGGIA